jgi:hypothetical protein
MKDDKMAETGRLEQEAMKKWLANFLWGWESSGVLYNDAADFILCKVASFLKSGDQHQLQDSETYLQDRETH